MRSKRNQYKNVASRWAVPSHLLPLLFASLSGCGGGTVERVSRVGVYGHVTLDGKPLKAGAIVFHHPASGEDGSSMRAFGFVENGRYRIDADNGPAVGTARVEFHAKPLDRERVEAALDVASKRRGAKSPPTDVVDIPPKYGTASELQVELVGGDENQHDFQLVSR